MNLQYPKLIMRNDSIGIETYPHSHYFCTQALLLFATILHTQCLPTVFRVFQVFRNIEIP